MRVLFRLRRPRPSSILRFARRRSRALTTNASNAAPKWGSQATATAVAAAAIAGYGALHPGTAGSDVPVALLREERLPKVSYATSAQMEKAIDKIREELSDTEGIISVDSDDLFAHSFSEWSSTNIDKLPVAIAYPRNTEQVSVIARICYKWKVPIIPFSGGSSLEGHITAPFGGITVDFSFMDQILQVHEEDMDVVVQPGVCWTDLNHELEKRSTGLWFPVDPAPSAKIGGMIATNCSGTNAVRYGTMRDWVINLTVVLADGSVVKTRRRPRKCSAGYNLNGLIVGSEGTLGLVTEATLKLAAKPQHTSVAVVPFPSMKSAVSAASSVIRHGVQVAAVELMDEDQMRIVNEGGATRPRLWKEEPTLFFKFSGTEASVADNIQTVKEIIRQHKPANFEFAKDDHEQKMLWSARKESLYSMLAIREEGETIWTTDVAVPLSRLTEIVEISKEEGKALGLKVSVKGHVGDSNFHENILYTRDNPDQAANAELAVRNMVNRALEMEGTCTGEHGIGLGKRACLVAEVGSDTILAMKLIKGALDPLWIMNPGKIFGRE